MPVSVHIKMDDFTNHEIEMYPDDQIYLFSDGFADQFGGPKNKTFKHKAFRKLLLDHAKKSMHEQKNVINESFEDWKGECDQVDDIVIIGLKI